MPNIKITTEPTGRSPENKYFFGSKTKYLDLDRPKYNKIGNEEDYKVMHMRMDLMDYSHNLVFYAAGMCFRVETNDDRHAQFVRNMFPVVDNPLQYTADWTIIHNTEMRVDNPYIYVHLDECVMLIGGTTFLGEIKKGVFSIISFELPVNGTLPMHCSAFTYDNTTNLMFGLSGTGKTTLSSDPDYKLISDDEVYWAQDGIRMVETGCYFTHPDNIFFLTMDVTGKFPAVSKITNGTIKRFFETGYTSQMPGTEAGTNEIKKIFSPCYGSPFMPRKVSEYSDLLMQKIHANNCNVYLINTGMDKSGNRHGLDFTRQCVKSAIKTGTIADDSKVCLEILEELIN